MIDEYNKAKIDRIINHYPHDKQVLKCIEECIELADALFHEGANSKITQELADVLITVQEIIEIYDCEKEVREWIDYKLNRQIERIEVEK